MGPHQQVRCFHPSDNIAVYCTGVIFLCHLLISDIFEQGSDSFTFLFLLDVRFVFPSGNWHTDRLTIAEKLAYQRAMGFNN